MRPILLITAGFFLSWLWLVLPARKVKPFPFHKDIEISLQVYYDYVLVRVMYVFFAYLLYQAYQTGQMKLVFFLFIGYLVDYLLIYNDPWAWLNFSGVHKVKPEGAALPLSYSLVMWLTLIGLCILSFK